MNKDEFKNKLRYSEVERQIRMMYENGQIPNKDLTLDDCLESFHELKFTTDDRALEILAQIREENE